MDKAMLDIHDLIELAIRQQASDLVIKAGSPPALRIDGRMIWCDLPPFSAEQAYDLAVQIVACSSREEMLTGKSQEFTPPEPPDGIGDLARLDQKDEIGLVFSVSEAFRIRAQIYLQNGTTGASLHIVSLVVPTLDELGAPPALKWFARARAGLILVTGTAGSSTTATFAAIIEQINQESQSNIFIIEDQTEYQFTDRCSMIHQREIGYDTNSFQQAYRGALEQSADVIAIDALSDVERIEAGIASALSGRLVVATVGAISLREAFEGMIGSYQPSMQPEAGRRLSEVLLCAAVQRCSPECPHGGREQGVDLLQNGPKVKQLLRSGDLTGLETYCAGDDRAIKASTLNSASPCQKA